jgi:glycosyltransferase involved in cell wall biosynthesis
MGDDREGVLTVLLATRNGAATLPRVLDAYCALEPPPGGWKVVIVDNGSTDSSRDTIKSFTERLPLTYVYEPATGKNAALNTGLKSVSGDVVVLTDDDAVPKQDWLIRLREAADANPSASIFGGAVVPLWESKPPAWLLDDVPLGWTYTVSDPNLKAGAVGARQIFGPNMAVRRAIFEKGYRFDASIGPDGSRSYAMGSETEFVLRVMSEGARAWYVPTAVVQHCVRVTQMRRSWIIGRMARAGRCECRLYLTYPRTSQWYWGVERPPHLTPRLLGFPLPLVYLLVRRTGSVVGALASLRKERVFRSLWILSYVYGFTREAQLQVRGDRSTCRDEGAR